MSFEIRPGFSFARLETGEGSLHTVLGPLARGDVVRRMVVEVHLFGLVAWRFGASLGLSQSGTPGALLAGRSLITASDVGPIDGGQGVPEIGFTSAGVENLHYEFFPGMKVTGAAGWIVVHSLSFAAPGLFIVVAFEIVRLTNEAGKVVVAT